MDIRQLLKYEINYIEISKETHERRNLTKFLGRDACGGSDWQTTDHKPSDSYHIDQHGNTEWANEQTFIRPLKPFTYYAVYVTTMIGKTSLLI